jgi:ubiquinone/menaquinone biosynthesis C-methylase UbiE
MTSREFWDRYLRAYDALNRFGDYQSGLRQMADRLAVGPGSAVLDAGSGTGNLSILLQARGADVTSLDFSPVAVEIHRSKASSAKVLQASLESPLPFPGGSFDRVVCASVLFTLTRAGCMLALREFRRVLRPGGLLLVTAIKPKHSKLEAFWAHLRSRLKSQSFPCFVREMSRTIGPLLRVLYYNYRIYGLARQGSHRSFTAEELVEVVAGAGFVGARCELTYGGRFHQVTATVPCPCSAEPMVLTEDRAPTILA